MGNFNITGPDGKKYKVTGDNAEGALAALRKSLAASSTPSADPAVAPEDTGGFSKDALADALAIPSPPDVPLTPKPAPSGVNLGNPADPVVPRVQQPANLAPVLPTTDAAPTIDMGTNAGRRVESYPPSRAPAPQRTLMEMATDPLASAIAPQPPAPTSTDLAPTLPKAVGAPPVAADAPPLPPPLPPVDKTKPLDIVSQSPFAGTPDRSVITGLVTKVLDGDTLEVGGHKIRVQALDCPEKNRFGGTKATALLTELADGSIATVETNGEVSYDRLTGYVTVDGKDVGGQMIGAGVCGVWQKFDSKGRYIGTYKGAPITEGNGQGIIPTRFLDGRLVPEADPMPAPGMMGGATDDQAEWAKREIARKEADPLADAIAPAAPPVDGPADTRQGFKARALGFKGSEQPAPAVDENGQPYQPFGEAVATEIGNAPERFSRGIAGNELLGAEQRFKSEAERVGTLKGDPAQELQAIALQKQKLTDAMQATDDPNEYARLEAEYRQLSERQGMFSAMADDPALQGETIARSQARRLDAAKDRTDAAATIEAADKGMVETNPAPGISKTFVQAFASAADMAPGLATSVITRNPLPALIYMGATSRGSTYADKRKDGVAPDKAALAANLYAAAETIPEVLPLEVLLKEGVGVVAKTAGAVVTEAASEAFTSGLQSLVDIGVLDKSMTWAEARAAMADSAAVGGAMGLVMGGAVGGAEAVFARKKEAAAKKGTPGDPNANPATPGPAKPPADPLADSLTEPTEPKAPAVDPKVTATAALTKFATASKGAAMIPDSAPDQEFKRLIRDAEKAGLTDDEIDAALSGRADASAPPTPKQDAPPASAAPDPLTAALAPDAAPVVEADKAPAAKPAEAKPQDGFEIMDEVENVDGETRPTGRKVRINTATGDAEVVDEGSDAAKGEGIGGLGPTGDKPQAERGVDVVSPPPPPAGPETAPTPKRPPAMVDGKPGPTRKFLNHAETLAIETDSKTFQYKGNGDAEGVTEALRGVKQFDPNRAGQVVLFETKDGRTIVADGHQRTGLARRMAEAGQADVGGMAAVVYREADGWTADAVTNLAALKNIGEGSGTAVDAARVLRGRKETVADLGLPPNSALVRKAEGLRRLSPDAFGMVVNGVATEELGDVVGRNVTDPALQPQVLAYLAKNTPANLAQAAMIARDMASDSTTETQDSLFGPEQIQQSLYVERAKVLDFALKDLGSDISTFSTVIKKAEALSAAGNSLKGDANAAIVDDATKIRQYLTSQANMKGPVSDALRKAAEAVRSGGTIAGAAKGFIRDAKQAISGTGTGSQAPAPGGSPNEVSPTVEPEAVAPEDGGDDLFGALLPPSNVKKPDTAPKPQDDLLAALNARPAGKTFAQMRKEDEAKVKAQQSKMRTAAPQGDEGPLFNTQSDIEKPAQRTPGEALRDDMRARLAPFEVGTDKITINFTDMSADPAGQTLLGDLAKAKGLEARGKIADAWVVKHGKLTGIEHIVVFDRDGIPLAMGKGEPSTVNVPEAIYLMADKGQIGRITHNHPKSLGFSRPDLRTLFIGFESIVAVGHNGQRHKATVGPMLAGIDTGRETSTENDLNTAFIKVFHHVNSIVQAMVSALPADQQSAFIAKATPADANIASLVLDRMGLIAYEGDAAKTLEGLEVNLDDITETAFGLIEDRLRGAGLPVSKIRDRIRDNKTGGIAAPAVNQGATGGVEANAPDSNGSGGLPNKPVKPAKPLDDFDTTAADILDQMFGKPAAPKRSDDDIAKDLGDLFNEDPSKFLSPLERKKAKAKARPGQQKDLFDMLNAASPGERQMDLEDLIQEQKDRGRDLFGFNEDIISLEKYAKAVPMFREALDGQDVAGQPLASTIRAVVARFANKGLTREGIERMLPYLKLYVQDVQNGNLANPADDSDVSGTGSNLEPNSGNAKPANGMGAANVPPAPGGSGAGAGAGGSATDGGNGQQSVGNKLPAGNAASVGKPGNPKVSGTSGASGKSASGTNNSGSGDLGQQGISPDLGGPDLLGHYAQDKPEVTARKAAQAAADAKAKASGVLWANEQNIRDTLPLLQPAQQDDVLKIETRFAKPDGHGMLLTNGTGTGKTYSGGGTVKRFVQAGKTNILIMTPSAGVVDHWIKAGSDLGLSITKLEDTKDAGKGVVVTTYANAGMNNALANREWDLIVTDEAHTLSSAQGGGPTLALDTLRAISHRPADLGRKFDMLNAAAWDKIKAMRDGEAKSTAYRAMLERRRTAVAAMETKPRSKVLFLSATPFAYDKSVDYAEGYLFNYPNDGRVNGSNQSGRNLFMVENFGYRIRYHKLTKPETAVDSGVFERQFHDKMRNEGVLSGRMLDIEPDYQRRFVQTEDAKGNQIDDILEFIREQMNGKGAMADDYKALSKVLSKHFGYLKRMQLLEAIKARTVQADIDRHLAAGRKVVVFHDFNVGGGFAPFLTEDPLAAAGYAALTAARPEVLDLDFSDHLPPGQELLKRYGDRARIYSGLANAKDRAANKALFQKDGSGVDIIIVQSAAGQAGIDLHDVTGKHQRVMINLGMPGRPTTALQEEGRIRRDGSVTDAMFHYYTIGTAWERAAFAKKIAERSGTVENLALGNEARTIRESFIAAYEEADIWTPSDEDGKGGKMRDRTAAKASPYEIAKTHYFGRMKTIGKRTQRDGIDFYPTPEPLAFKMVEWAQIRPYERALEPSAGDGSIARYMPEHADRTIVEPSTDLMTKAQLRAAGARAVNGTFENYNLVNKHHAIVMNPPFGSGGKTAYEHLEKAMLHLKPGGRIVALVPTGPAADKRLEALDMKGFHVSGDVALPAVTFEKAGTAIASRILIIDKTDIATAPSTKYINMTGSETINAFFDRLEGISVQDRPEAIEDASAIDVTTDEEGNVIEVTAPPPANARPGPALVPATSGGFKLAETKHAKTGDDLYVATIVDRVDKDTYSAVLAVAKRHGGWYYSFRGNGAIPGFQFKTETGRAAFVEDMGKPTVGFEETAYHGTPHEFDRFSLDMIGTGEGAQAYGWGLYFAGRRQVAEYYKKELSNRQAAIVVDGKRVDSGYQKDRFNSKTSEQWAVTLLRSALLEGQSISAAIMKAKGGVDRAKRGDVTAFQRESGWDNIERLESVVTILQGWEKAEKVELDTGRLFTVDIPDADQMLDYNARLSEQPDHVTSAMRDLMPDLFGSHKASVWTEEPETQSMRRAWTDQFGWQIVDFGTFFAVNSPSGKVSGGNTVSENSKLDDAKKSAASARKHYSGDTTGADAYRLLSARIGGDKRASEALRDAGIPGHRYLDGSSRGNGEGTHNYVIYDDSRIQIMGFEEPSPPFEVVAAYEPLARDKIAKMMPALKAELQRLDLGRVNLYLDDTGAEWQGMVIGDPLTDISVIIGASLDPMKTVHHEVIHILRAMGLFTPQEWTALEDVAAKKWMQKHDIAERYPDLPPVWQIEEAIAEEFAEAVATKKAPTASTLTTAFNKIARLLRAFRNVLNGAGFQTAEDVFGRVIAGELTKRNVEGMARVGMAQRQERKRVASLTGKELGAWDDVRELAKKAEAWYRSNLVGTSVKNAQTGWAIKFSNVGAKKLGSGKGPDLLRIVPSLREILEKGTIIGSEADRQGRPQIKAIHKLAARVMLDGTPRDVIATIRETNEGNFHYDIGRDMSDGARFTPAEQGEAAVRMDDAQVRSPALEGNSVEVNLDQKPEENKTGLNETKPRFQRARLPSAQARAHMATPMGGQHLHIPDRRIWDQLSAANATVWQRLKGGGAAAMDAVDKARFKIQDRMLPLLRAQEAVMRLRGAPLPADMDAYTVETTFSGKVGRHLFEIDEEYTKPIIALIAKTKGGLTSDSVGEWLYARHAVERNARIASINPRMPDGGSGMIDADAQAILQAAAAGPHAATLLQIGALIDQLRERSLRLREDKGLMTHADAQMWRTQYKHYVPMKGFADTEHSDAMLDVSGVGRRFNTRGGETRRALGRNSEAFNPLQAAITQAQEVAIRAEKNAVGQATYELAKSYPSPALWSIKKIKTVQVYNRSTGLVETRTEDPISMFMDPNEMAVKISGQEHRILFHDPRLAMSLGSVGADQLSGLVRILSRLSQFFSMTRTMLNPEFMITNAFRDFQTAQFNIQAFGTNGQTGADDRAAIALAMTKNWRKAFAGAYRGQSGKADTVWSKHYKEFQKAGAQVSFWSLDQPEASKEDLDRRIDLARGSKAARMLKVMTKPKAFFSMRDNAVLSFIERTNMAVDNAIRLAAFVEARKRGWNVQDAAFLSKELTVNFNRRGENTTGLNALFPFFNAAVQGSLRTVKALSARRVAIMVTLAVAGGVVLDLANAMLSDRDDDDDLFYDKIPEYRSERNLHLVLWGTGDNPLAIPMPYGYNLFPYAGQQIGKVMRGIKTPEQAFGDVMAAAFGAFSPINGGSASTTVAPFFADPFIEMAENKDFAGNPIYPRFPKEGLPDSQVFNPSASEVSKWVAETLNEITGGDLNQPGLVDVSPETLDHLSSFVVGSAGAFWGRTSDVLAKAVQGKFDEIEQRQIPLVRTVTSPIGPWIDRSRFYQFGDDVKDAAADAKRYVEQGKPVPRETAIRAALYQDLLAANRELKGTGDWNPSKAGALTPRPEQAIWLDFNKRYLKATRPRPIP